MKREGVATVNPATAEELGFYPFTSPTEIDRVLDFAASSDWGGSTVDERVGALHRLAAELTASRERFSRLITREMGKPISQSRAEIDKCVATCRYYAEHLPSILEPEQFDIDGDLGMVRIAPLGVVFAILPWNYPWWQVIRAMLPAVLAGDTVVLKHAEAVTGSALAIEDVFLRTFGHGVLQTVIVPASLASDIIDDPRVAAVTFTGSDRVGAMVAARAGAVVKKCVLELGGSDPFLVLADADIDAAAAAAARSRFLNNGQSCIAAKRIIVHADVRDDFVDALTPHVRALRVGDPEEESVDVGPLARNDLRDTLQMQYEEALAAGGRVLVDADAPARGVGAWFAPAVVEVERRDSILLTDETFGPLAALITGRDDDDLVTLANASRYGLSSSVWSTDTERARVLSSRIRAGAVYINAISATDPRLPTGGVRASGYGRELGKWGVHELANLQALRVHAASGYAR